MRDDNIREWLEVAAHDIDTVSLLIREKGHADIIVYHTHQAVEKLIKAILIKCDVPFEKIHRLDKLLSLALTHYPELMNIKDEVLEIDYYMPKLRYPAGERIEFNTAEEIFEKFKKIEGTLRHCAGLE